MMLWAHFLGNNTELHVYLECEFSSLVFELTYSELSLVAFSLEVLTAEWIIDVVRDGDDIDPYVFLISFLISLSCFLLKKHSAIQVI